MRAILILLCLFFLSPAPASSWAPDFLVLGAQKSGTTALYHMLIQHPLVVKRTGELHFFDLNYRKGVEWYQSQFPEKPEPHYLAGEKSPYYLFHPLVPSRVKALYPHVKLIIVLRNPIDRAYSHYWHNVRDQRETLSFAEALKAEPSRLAGQQKKLQQPGYKSPSYLRYSYLARGIYVEQIQRWLNVFPREQFFIISSRDLKEQPVATMNSLFAFLGLPAYPVSYPDADNRFDYPRMNPQLREVLRAYFKPFNQQLEILLDRKFDWD